MKGVIDNRMPGVADKRIPDVQYQPIREVDGEVFPRASVPVMNYRDGKLSRDVRNAICEQEVTLVANGEQLVTLLCSDTALRELAYGFLFSEGIIVSLTSVLACSLDAKNHRVSFQLDVPVSAPTCLTLSSGFGGKVLSLPFSRSGAAHSFAEVAGEGSCTMADVTRAVSIMRSFAREYTVTRGIHCSALFKRGVPLASFEDIGRHNTFDKLAGWCLLNGCSAQGALLTTTGRVSGEMVAKALKLGVRGIASLSGPTDKAIALANTAGMLLAGYVTETTASVYAGMDQRDCS